MSHWVPLCCITAATDLFRLFPSEKSSQLHFGIMSIWWISDKARDRVEMMVSWQAIRTVSKCMPMINRADFCRFDLMLVSNPASYEYIQIIILILSDFSDDYLLTHCNVIGQCGLVRTLSVLVYLMTCRQSIYWNKVVLIWIHVVTSPSELENNY